MSKKDKDAKDKVKQEMTPTSQDENKATSDQSETGAAKSGKSSSDSQQSTTQDKKPSSSRNSNGAGTHSGKKTPSGNTSTAKKPSPMKWIIIVIILAIIGAGGYYGWTLWNNYQTAQEKASTLDQLQQQVQQQQGVINNLASDSRQQANELSQVNHQLSLQLEQLQNELKKTQQKITSTDEQQNQWMLAEAEYLIRQASYKLHYTNNAKTIVGLLQAADRQVLAMNDSSLQPLRQAISNDINVVRASGALDIKGVAIKLQSLKPLVEELELATVQLPDGDESQTATDKSDAATEEEISGWQRFKNSFSSALSQYYTVHRYDESMKPFISPHNDGLLRQNILLNLQTAQLAAIQHNDAVYQNALGEVEDWVVQYFKSEPATTTAFMQQLDELLQMNVALDLPQQLESLRAIEQTTGRHSRSIQEAQQKPVQETVQEKPQEPAPATSEGVAQ